MCVGSALRRLSVECSGIRLFFSYSMCSRGLRRCIKVTAARWGSPGQKRKTEQSCKEHRKRRHVLRLNGMLIYTPDQKLQDRWDWRLTKPKVCEWNVNALYLSSNCVSNRLMCRPSLHRRIVTLKITSEISKEVIPWNGEVVSVKWSETGLPSAWKERSSFPLSICTMMSNGLNQEEASTCTVALPAEDGEVPHIPTIVFGRDFNEQLCSSAGPHCVT